MERVSNMARQEIIRRQKKAYQKAAKKTKGAILDTICQATGMSRDRAGRLLRENQNVKKEPVKRRGRKPQYHHPSIHRLLEKLWFLMDCACGKRLCAGLPGMIDALVRHGEIQAPEWTIQAVLRISPATADRLLAQTRRANTLMGRSATKPGSIRKKDIPIRLGSQWDDHRPGYIEMDLVAHCGETTAGEYVNTLDMTDIYSGWTETVAVLNKAQKHVFAAIQTVRARLPFDLLGLDSDNGSEFINDQMYRYCKKENLLFTRSRPHKKNDNCHVEQKNYSVVRKHIGYARYEGEKVVKLLNKYYAHLRLHTNFFMPSVKLVEKERIGARVYKRYDSPTTPYERLMVSPDISHKEKLALKTQFHLLNPVVLKRDMMELTDQILSLAIHRTRSGHGI